WAAGIDILSDPNFYGGVGGLALDGAGNVYTAGALQGASDFDPGAGTYYLTSTPYADGSPSGDVFVSELTQSSTVPATVINLGSDSVAGVSGVMGLANGQRSLACAPPARRVSHELVNPMHATADGSYLQARGVTIDMVFSRGPWQPLKNEVWNDLIGHA